MSHHGPLRNEFFKYRKRKQISLDGSVSGVEYGEFHRPSTPSLGSTAVRGGAYEHRMYMGRHPEEYRPNINAPAVQNFDYETGESFDIPTINKTPDARRNLSEHLPEIPGNLFLTVRDDLTLEEQFLMNMGVRPRPQEGPVEMSLEEISPLIDGVRGNIHIDDIAEVDTVRRLSDIRDALRQLKGVLPEDHPDIINLRNAAHIMSGKVVLPELLDAETAAPDIASAQPYNINQVLDAINSYQLPIGVDDVLSAHDIQSKSAEVMNEDVIAQDVSLEQIVENESAVGQLQPDFSPDINVAITEINNAVNQIIDAPIPQPEPFQMEEAPYLIAQRMFDQQMLFMDNPCMMPGW
jgi:hypothetical protein